MRLLGLSVHSGDVVGRWPVPALRPERVASPKGETMNRQMMTRRIGLISTAGLLTVLGLLLTGCLAAQGEARGGGYLGAPLQSGTVIGVYQGRAEFGFRFRCEVRNGKAVVQGQLEYRDSARSTITVAGNMLTFADVVVHGVVDPLTFDASTCADINTPVARLTGTYRPQSSNRSLPSRQEEGRFQVVVYDEGEPGSSRTEITGDAFSIELYGGRYTGYQRAGYIEGGNVQVK